MQNAWNEILAFMRISGQGGAYWYLAVPAVLFLLFNGSAKGIQRRTAAGFCAIALLFCNPLTAAVYEKAAGTAYPLWKVTLGIPLLPFLAYAGVMLAESLCKEAGNKKSGRYAVGVGIVLVIMMSGTIMPWSERTDLEYAGRNIAPTERQMMEEVSEAASVLIGRGDGALLVAPKGIMNSIRRYDSRIQLVYGRNLWQTGALDYLHETYTDAAILLCQRMENTEANVTETVEMALEQGCNLIVCREELSSAFTAANYLSLYAQTDGLYLYVR